MEQWREHDEVRKHIKAMERARRRDKSWQNIEDSTIKRQHRGTVERTQRKEHDRAIQRARRSRIKSTTWGDMRREPQTHRKKSQQSEPVWLFVVWELESGSAYV